MSTFIEKDPVFYFGELGQPCVPLYRISLCLGKIYIYEVGVEEENSLRLIITESDWREISKYINSTLKHDKQIPTT